MLLADIGGTNVRFATLTDDGRIEAVESWLTALYPDIGAAVRAYAELTGLALPVRAAAVCAVGPLIDDSIDLTNCAWKISTAEIAAATGAPLSILVNDFSAVAQALPVLSPSDVIQIGGDKPLAHAPKVVLGPGTGLGVATAVSDGRGGWIATAGEGTSTWRPPTSAR